MGLQFFVRQFPATTEGQRVLLNILQVCSNTKRYWCDVRCLVNNSALIDVVSNSFMFRLSHDVYNS